MNNTTHQSRRRFLMSLAKGGLLLPFANQLLSQRVLAAQGQAKRVLFLYYPNGVVPYNWRPSQGAGSIVGSRELSFGLGPLSNWHPNLTVLQNLTLDIGQGAGAHYNDMRGILTGNNQISTDSASIDHLIAEQLGDEGVLNLGVRTGPKSDIMISKPRGYSTNQRPIPNNDPKDVAGKLALRVGDGSVSEPDPQLQAMYDTLLSDFDRLSDATLSQARLDKLARHREALVRLKNLSANQVGDCALSTNKPADPYAMSEQQLSPDEWQQFPSLCRAQIDNIVSAFSCGLHRVATLQLSKGDENGNLVNYAFDECWQMAQDAMAQGIKATENGSEVTPITRWYNEFSSHSASHRPGDVPHTAQVRWYHSLLAYTLEQLDAAGLLSDTLVVTFSEVGDGSKHGGAAGAVSLAGGAGGALSMGQVINCGDGINNGYRRFGTHDLFGDIARLMGVNNLPEPHWNGGVV